MIGTVDALNRRIQGGFTPGGIRNRMEFTAAPTWDMAASIRTWGWNEILITLAPLTVCESIDLTSFTTAITNSLNVVTLCSISLAGRPEYDQITVTTGISILGKMSVGVVAIDVKPRTRIRMEATMKVYGLFSASRTIHMGFLQQVLRGLSFT